MTLRQRGQLAAPPKPGTVVTAEQHDPVKEKSLKEELQGVFVVNSGKAEFREVKTGITGSTDVEVLDGVKEGDEIVTGTYQVLRSLRNDAKVKIDNKPVTATPGPGTSS